MKRTTRMGSRLCFAALSLMLVLFTAPTWADPGNNVSRVGPPDKTGQVNKEDRNLHDGDKSKNGSKKGGSSAKKKAVKSVGTAAVAGVATKKVTSEIKK